MFARYVEYIKDNPKGYWFKRKWFGWGWTPATWQGWLISLLYVGAILFFALTIDEGSTPSEVLFTLVLPFVLLTTAFIRICYAKGEKPGWQWGPPKSK